MTQPLPSPTDLLQGIICHLTDAPEQVVVTVVETPRTVTCDVEVPSSDVGKVIGARGSYADALRLVFGAIYGKEGKRFYLQVDERSRE